MATPAITAAKHTLRKLVKDTLKTLSAEEIAAQSKTCHHHLLTLPEYLNSTRISIYLSMPTCELQTTHLLEDSFSCGKQIFVPYIHRTTAPPQASQHMPTTPTGPPLKSVMDMLTLASLEEYRNLPRDKWGIPSLPSDGVGGRENPLCDGADANGREGKGEGKAETGGLDLVIVPGVAFGVDGRRLGHGKGYYDTWIERYARVWGQVPVLVGTALKEQVFEEGKVPVDGTDWIVDILVTGDGRVIRNEEARKMRG